MKQFFESYGAVALGILALLVLIAMITPVGNIIKTSLQGTVQTFSTQIESQQEDVIDIDMNRFSTSLAPTNLINNENGRMFADSYGNYTYNDFDKSHSIEITTSTGDRFDLGGLRFDVPMKLGHKYFVIFNYKTTISDFVYVEYSENWSGIEAMSNTTANEWQEIKVIFTSLREGGGMLLLKQNNQTVGKVNEYKNIGFYDLTEIYGAGNEPDDYEQIKQDLFL